MQPLNAIAVRQPANTPPAAGPAASNATANEPVTAESLGWQLRAALPPLRLHSVSLYDDQANVLWLSEGALGPDEHMVVVEANDALAADTSLSCYETGLEDGRVALFLPVRSPQGSLVGLAMILADMKSVGDGVVERLATPQIRAVLQKVAVLLRSTHARATAGEPIQSLELAADTADTPASAPARQPPVLSPEAVDNILEFELTPDPLPHTPTPSQTQRLAALAAFNSGDLSLESASQKSDSKPSTAPSNVAPFPSSAAASTSSAAANAPKPAASTPKAPASASPAAAVATVAPPAAVPSTAAPPAAIPVLTAAAASPVNSGSTTTSKVLAAPGSTGTSKALGSSPPDASKSLSATSTSKSLSATSSSKSLSATSSSKSLSATSTSKSLSATSTSRVLAMPEGMTLTLEIQPFTKLRSGGRTRRYEVLARSSHPNRLPPGMDKIALQQLLTWMGANRNAWSLEPTSFTLNLSISTLEDERFPQFVASTLKTHGIAGDNIGFEIAEPLCLQRRAQVERFITLCDKLGCFVVIDDFSLDSSIVSLLRSKALRAVKIDPKLTSAALKDKLAQAMVVAITQASKVLGIHCAAKRVDSQAALQWLTGIGCDFAQGTAVAQPQPLESLGLPPSSGSSPPAA